MESSTSIDLESPTTNGLSPVETLFGVLTSPYRTFVRMREAVVGHWWVVLILAVIGLGVSTIATVPIQSEAARAVLEAQQEQFSDLPEAQQVRIQQQQEVFSSQAVLGGLNLVGGLVVLVIGYLIRAGILYLLGLAFGGRASFKQVWRMAVWTTLPDVFRMYISSAAVFVTQQLPVSGLSYIFTPAEMGEVSPILVAFLSGIDVYMVWSLVLMGVGLVATYQISKGKSALITLIYWLIGVAFTLGFAALDQMMQSAFVPAG